MAIDSIAYMRLMHSITHMLGRMGVDMHDEKNRAAYANMMQAIEFIKYDEETRNEKDV